ncbi:MAG: hypothetical protein IJT18_08110, partial [Oscillospiraceae bacterium]|nr:hypothetical protein [Oscillospiraceae bacterium]
MSLDKIENTEVNNNSVEGLVPGDRMSGTSLQNKRIFDQLVRDVVVPKFNALIDALTETTGADEIGVNDEELHVQAETVQEALDAAKAAVGHKHAAGDIETGTLPVSRGGTGRTSFTDGSYLVGGATGGIALKSKVGVKDDLGINDKMDKANPLGAGNLSMSGKITAGADGTADNDLLRKAQIVALLAALTAADISADDTEMSKLSGGTVQAILESVDVALWSLTAADIEANNGVTEEPLQDLLDTILAALAAAATSAQLTAFEQALADDGVDSGTPGASLIGAVSLDGETGSTVAAVLDAIKTALAGKASSAALADDGIISGTPGAGMIGTTDLMGESSTVEAELQSHRNELDSLETYKMSKANPSGTGNLTMTGKVTAGAAATADNDLMRKGEVDTALDAKLNAASPSFTGGITGTGALSVNRLSGSTVGDYSAALGESTVAQSRGSVAVGRFTYATTAGQFTCGVYSKGDTNQVFIVG